jgi:prepilin-type N-terminal cleavage/methylation domain-containing protein
MEKRAMTTMWATGHRSNRRRQCAFTLIELILVMTLLVVIVSMVAPRMAGFIRGRALDSEARRWQALAHAGQSRAVSEGMPMVLWLDAKQGAYGLEEETPPASGDPKAESVTMAENVQATVLTQGGTAPTTFHNLPAVRFLADGSIDENSPHTVQLGDASGGSLWLVELKNRTGYEIRDTAN